MDDATLDVRAAVSTIDRALAYTQPLRRRTEGLTWMIFGLSCAFSAFGIVLVLEHGSASLVYWAGLPALGVLAVVPALLAWRVAGAVEPDVEPGKLRVGLVAIALAVGLVVIDDALWAVARDSTLTLALNVALFGCVPWGALGAAQWSRLSRGGRKLTWIVAGAIAAVGVAVSFALGLSTSDAYASALVFVAAASGIPFAVGVWRVLAL